MKPASPVGRVYSRANARLSTRPTGHPLVSRTGHPSCRATAEACNVSQPALTKSIQRLEDELGGPLLLRERSLTRLTQLGQEMLPMLEQVHSASERAKEHAVGMKRQTASPLRLGFDPDVPVAPFTPLFRELATHLPGFELSLANADGAELCDAMLHGALDAAVVTGDAVLPDRLHRWTLFTDQAALLIPPGHPLASAGAAPLAALDGGAVVCRGADCWMAGLVAQAAREHEALPAQRHRADTAGQAADLVRVGLGVAFSTERAALPDGLDRRPVAGQAAHDVVLAVVAGRPAVRAADAFIKLARAREWGCAQVAALPPGPQAVLPTHVATLARTAPAHG